MSKVIPFPSQRRARARRRAPTGSTQAFAQEFEDFLLHNRKRIRGLPPAAPRAVARIAFRNSRGGRDWLAPNPTDLLCAAMPERWSLLASERALALVLRFNDFLAATGRQTPQDTAFAEGWTRAAQTVILKVLLQHLTRDDPPSRP